MDRLVWRSFMTIIIGTVIIIVISVAFYLIQVFTVNYRVEATMSTMINEISRQNYLTEDAYELYEDIFDEIIETNHVDDGGILVGWSINYDPGLPHSAFSSGTNLAVPLNYGDIAHVEVVVEMTTLAWGISPVRQYNVDMDTGGTREQTYTYTVPSLRYIP